MKIQNRSVDYNTPGLYWDGTTLWAVGTDGMGYMIGNDRSAFTYLESDDETPAPTEPRLSVTDIIALAGAFKR
ncbi:MAG: hypothetical protein AMJ84_00300 [Acidithiobacillales bacterium SM23_46]|nr:MAG: hypothetical protein AMJ84_00300 [Acidithiobacillales bacterium SM23_46]KPL29004.1 MAG: hypothetical protein AMJ72_00150 [Acidithiobacillales bacterium SM1_46]